jgi:transcriptional regulator with XRE-family HTH domain
MPAPSPAVGTILEKALRELGAQLRAQRKRLGVSATTTAEAAGMSRVTLHRIERGEPSVAVGAYLSVASSLGLKLVLDAASDRRKKPAPPSKIRIADYPTLKKLAWQLKGAKELSPQDALDLYERNWKHVDPEDLDERERQLLESLLSAFGRERLLV